jgi:hypothetical protein
LSQGKDNPKKQEKEEFKERNKAKLKTQKAKLR